MFGFFTRAELPLADKLVFFTDKLSIYFQKSHCIYHLSKAGAFLTVFLWFLTSASGSFSSNVFPWYRLWWWCLQRADSIPQRLAVQEGLTSYGWLVIPLHSIAVQILKRSYTSWLSLQAVYKQQYLEKLCSFSSSLSLFIPCFKNKFHMQTRGWLQKANYSQLRELEAPAFSFAVECVLHMNVVSRLPSNKQWCTYSILFPLPLTLPLRSPFPEPRFYFGFRSDCGPFIRS